jgi:hypothetical protein
MAAILNDLDAFLQADTPRTVSVNLGSNVNVNGTLGGTPVNTVVTNAANAAAHAASSGNPHGVSLNQIAGDLDDINDGVTFFRTNANQVTGAGRGFNALNSSSEYIKSLKSTQMTLVGSNPSTGIAMDGNGIRMYQSSVLRLNIPVSGDPYFNGTITGDSDITITGRGEFQGSSVISSREAAIHANTSLSANYGIQAFSGAAVGMAAVIGFSANGYGLRGEGLSSGAVGVQATNSFGGVALGVAGRMTITNTTLVSNLNADMVDGKHATNLCSVVVPETGTCNVSGGGINLISNVTSQQVRGNGSNGLIIETVSDKRLKTDIHPEIYGLEFVKRLKAKTFRMKNKPKIRLHGFISQDMRSLVDFENDALFSENEDGMLSTDYISLISPIVKSIQELSAEIDLLKSGKRKGRIIDGKSA